MTKKKYGLIGNKLIHSFSVAYFNEKFFKEGIEDVSYENYELSNIEEVTDLLKNGIDGFNVTIPYKTAIIPYLAKLSETAKEVNAVNTVKKEEEGYVGYNTDVYGFEKSLTQFIGGNSMSHALILGTGGASKAIEYVLKKLNIESEIVSRNKQYITYNELTEEHISLSNLIINTTPLGMYPDLDSRPFIPYRFLTPKHFLYDLVYNPKISLFLKSGLEHNCQIKNGADMLIYQAEKSWEIWNQR